MDNEKILAPYRMQNGKYNIDALYNARRLQKPLKAKEYECRDLAEVVRNGVVEVAIVLRIFVTVSEWRTEPSNWNYIILFADGYSSHLSNFEFVRTLDASEVVFQHYDLFKDDTEVHFSSPITAEVFDTAVQANRDLEAAQKLSDEEYAQSVLAKTDDQISEVEWRVLMEQGYAETYYPAAPEDFAIPLLYRRTAKRSPLPLFASDTTEEELARKGL